MSNLFTTHTELDDLGSGKFRSIIHMRPIAYRENGSLKSMNSDWIDSGNGTRPHMVSAGNLMVTVDQDGDRRIHPTRELDKYFEIGQPWVKVGGIWRKVSMGSPSRQKNKIIWTRPQTITTIAHGGHYIKLDIELRNGWVPEDGLIAFPVDIYGLERNKNQLEDNGVPVMRLRPLHVEDADNSMDVRNINHEFVNLNGLPYLLLTLPDLTGMSRPVIDPTLSLQPDAADGKDTMIRSGINITNNYGVYPNMSIGEFVGYTGLISRGLVQFDLSSIPASASVISAILTMYEVANGANNNSIAYIYRLKRNWVEGTRSNANDNPPTGAVWTRYDTVNNWQVAGGFGADDCEQTDIGGRAFSATEAINQFKDWNLTSSAVQEWINGTFVNNGLLVKMNSELDDAHSFASSDVGVASQRPKLVIEYTTVPAAPTNLNVSILNGYEGSFSVFRIMGF